MNAKKLTTKEIPAHIQQIMSVVGPCILAFIAYQGVASNNRVEIVRIDLQKTQIEAKARAEEASAKLGQLKSTTDATHKLVNSGSLFTLKLYTALARRVADEGKKPADIRIAEQLEEELRLRLEEQEKDEANKINRIDKTMNRVDRVSDKVSDAVDEMRKKE